jgi:hypothetical protein
MSISTQGGGEQRRPSVVSTGGKKPGAGAKPSRPAGKGAAGAKSPAAGKVAAGKVAAGKGGARAGGGPRKPIAPVKVTQQRAWGPIILFLVVGLLAVGIIGYGAYAVLQGSKTWQDRANGISGIVDFRKTNPKMLEQTHAWGPIKYDVSPPVGGKHNYNWQNCMGDVYDAPIANEHAVHSLEHGAVWITYRPDLPKDQVDKLAAKVRGKEFMLMSPYEGLDSKISLQAWGYQLKVNSATDGRVDDFIKALRKNATMEPQAGCSGGITATGTTPRDLGKEQQGQ